MLGRETPTESNSGSKSAQIQVGGTGEARVIPRLFGAPRGATFVRSAQSPGRTKHFTTVRDLFGTVLEVIRKSSAAQESQLPFLPVSIKPTLYRSGATRFACRAPQKMIVFCRKICASVSRIPPRIGMYIYPRQSAHRWRRAVKKSIATRADSNCAPLVRC